MNIKYEKDFMDFIRGFYVKNDRLVEYSKNELVEEFIGQYNKYYASICPDAGIGLDYLDKAGYNSYYSQYGFGYGLCPFKRKFLFSEEIFNHESCRNEQFFREYQHRLGYLLDGDNIWNYISKIHLELQSLIDEEWVYSGKWWNCVDDVPYLITIFLFRQLNKYGLKRLPKYIHRLLISILTVFDERLKVQLEGWENMDWPTVYHKLYYINKMSLCLSQIGYVYDSLNLIKDIKTVGKLVEQDDECCICYKIDFAVYDCSACKKYVCNDCRTHMKLVFKNNCPMCRISNTYKFEPSERISNIILAKLDNYDKFIEICKKYIINADGLPKKILSKIGYIEEYHNEEVMRIYKEALHKWFLTEQKNYKKT